MNKLLVFASTFFILSYTFGQTTKYKKVKLTSIEDSASYALGLSVASSLAQENLDSINIEAFIAGFLDSNYPESYKIKLPEINKTIQNLAYKKLKGKFGKNIIAENNFLQENKKKPGVFTTESGLQYKIIQAGNGIKPQIYDSVTVNYKGTKLDGTIFDSSEDSLPVTFQLSGELIEGWIEVLQIISTGTKFELWVPSKLGYGMNGKGAIEPFDMLIYEIELLQVTKGELPTIDMKMLQQREQMQEE